MNFIDNFNGDWTLSGVVDFWTAGREISPERAKQLCYAAAIEIDILGGSLAIPSIDDWGSTAETAETGTLQIMCHDLFKRSLERALPSWGAGLPPNDRRVSHADDAADVARIKIQKRHGGRTSA